VILGLTFVFTLRMKVPLPIFFIFFPPNVADVAPLAWATIISPACGFLLAFISTPQYVELFRSLDANGAYVDIQRAEEVRRGLDAGVHTECRSEADSDCPAQIPKGVRYIVHHRQPSGFSSSSTTGRSRHSE
jgi:hypothetical protein